MKIQEFRIYQLFGYLNPRIPLNSQESITIIHGPNGCGKTTILRLIQALFKADIGYLRRIPFESIEVVFDEGSILKVRRIEEPLLARQPGLRFKAADVTIIFSSRDSNGQGLEHTFTPVPVRTRPPIPLSMIEKEVPELMRVGAREWIHKKTNELLSLDQVLQEYGERVAWPIPEKKMPEWISQLINSVRVHMIGSQRLLLSTSYGERGEEEGRAEIKETIELYANELANTISEKLAESVSISLSLDRSFPSRLLRGTDIADISEEALRKRYVEVEEKRQNLMSVGLLEEERRVNLPVQSMDSTERRVLTLYIEDTEKKLHAFDELQKKLAGFSEIINSKMSQTKTIVTDRRKGFLFRTASEPTKILSPKQLSSGEQHQVVVFYDLIFRAKQGSLILIDEPEISLHVDWQRQFLKDLTRVKSLNNQEFLIATHSPQIIHNRWDLALPLSGGISRE